MAVLETVSRKHVTFDPGNAEHRAVYWRLRTTGRQDSELRFIIDEGFSSIITMMQTKLADYYCRPTEARASIRRIKG